MRTLTLGRKLHYTAMVVFRLIVASVAASAFAACSVRTADLTLVATQNIPSFSGEVRGPVEGRDCRAFVQPNLEEAIDDALAQAGGNLLTDASLYFRPGFFRACFIAKGTAVRLKEHRP